MRTTIAWVVDTLKALVGRGEFPHAYNCFQHGGSEACEKSNRRLGFKCPKCVAPNEKLTRPKGRVERRVMARQGGHE
jgi:hypothetical protein